MIPIEFTLIATSCVWATVITDYHFAFLPDAYYHPILQAPNVIYFSWVSLPLSLIFAFTWPKGTSKKRDWIEISVQLIIILALCRFGIPRYNDQKSYQLKELDYYARNGQWDQIIRNCQGPIKNYLYLTYLNNALAEKGELGNRMFAYPVSTTEHDLLIRAEQDPENQLPIQFTGAIYLLSKDMKAFQRLIEKALWNTGRT